MKKRFAIVTSAVLAAALVVPAFGAAIRTADAQLRSDFTIVVDGDEVDFKTASGDAVYPILYEGNTYLPLRAIGELMGKNVNWDEKNKVVTISGTRNSVSSDKENPYIGKKDIQVQERPDFTIVVENAEKEFYSVTGQRVYPILYNGSTYLPLRAIGEIMNKEVVWNNTTKTITLNGNFTVTDADSFDTEKEEIAQGYIGGESAKNIALGFANLLEKDVTFLRTQLNFDDGRWVYDVEFYSGNKEYDFEIDAQNGKVLDYDYDVENWSRPTTTTTDIGLEKAKEIALSHAGLKANQVKFVKTDTDYDNGRKYYEVEFYKGNQEYDYEIDAATGKITDVDYDAENYTKPSSSNTVISADEARQIALKHAGVSSSNVRYDKTELDYDDGVQKYEIEFRVGQMEYEYEINAVTGTVLKAERDYD